MRKVINRIRNLLGFDPKKKSRKIKGLLRKEGNRVDFICHEQIFSAIVDGNLLRHETYDDWKMLQCLKGKPDWFEKNWEATRDKQIRHWEFAEVLPGEKILEVGFRDGFNLQYLHECGINVVGMEVNEAAVRHARDLGCTAYLEDIQRRTRFPDETFDLISACDVLEHCFSPREAMIEMRRIVKKDGRIVIEIPFENEFTDNTAHGHSALFYNDDFADRFFQELGFFIVKKDLSDPSRNLYYLKPVNEETF